MTKINIRIHDVEIHFSSLVYEDYRERLIEMRRTAARNLEVCKLEDVVRAQEAIRTIDKILGLPEKMIQDYRAQEDRLAALSK